MKLKITNAGIFFNGFKSNYIFIGIMILYLLNIFLRIISINDVEWFVGAEYLFEAFTQLLLGAFISVIFYMILIYYPNYKKAQYIYKMYLLFLVGFITNYAAILMKKFDNKKIRLIDAEKLMLEIEKSDKVTLDDDDKSDFVEQRLLKNTYNFLLEEELSKIDEIDRNVYQKLRYIKVQCNSIFIYREFNKIASIKNSVLESVKKEDKYKLMIIENLQEIITRYNKILDDEEEREEYNRYMAKMLEE